MSEQARVKRQGCRGASCPARFDCRAQISRASFEKRTRHCARHSHCSPRPPILSKEEPMRFRRLLALLPAGVGLGLALASCTSGTVGAVVSCGPDDVATTTYDVATVTNFEASFYWAAADPIATGLYTFDVIRDAPQATSQAVSAASAAAAAVGSYYS